MAVTHEHHILKHKNITMPAQYVLLVINISLQHYAPRLRSRHMLTSHFTLNRILKNVHIQDLLKVSSAIIVLA